MVGLVLGSVGIFSLEVGSDVMFFWVFSFFVGSRFVL